MFLIPSVAPVRSRPFKIDTEAIGIVRILKTISFLQSTRTGGRAGFLICYCFLSSEQGKVYKGIDYLTRPVHPLKLGTLWKVIGMICVTECWLKSLGWVITKVGPVTKLERDIILYKSPPHTLAIIITVFNIGPERKDLKTHTSKKAPVIQRESYIILTAHTCNHHHRSLFPPLITGRLAVVHSYGSEVGTFWRLSTLSCFYAWKAVCSLNSLPCYPTLIQILPWDTTPVRMEIAF